MDLQTLFLLETQNLLHQLNTITNNVENSYKKYKFLRGRPCKYLSNDEKKQARKLYNQNYYNSRKKK